MKLVALDLATRCGWAYGEHDAPRPASGAWQLRPGEKTIDFAAAELGDRLCDFFDVNQVEECWMEGYMAPADHPDMDSLKTALMLRGVVLAVCRRYAVRAYDVSVQQARKDFCGKASAHPPRPPGSPPWPLHIAQQRRLDTKAMIWRAATDQGYFDRGEKQDFERSDAVCVWSFGAVRRGRTPPLVLV